MSSRPLSDRYFTLKYNGEQVLHKPLHKGDLLKPFVESIYMSKQHCIARCFAQHTQVKTRY